MEKRDYTFGIVLVLVGIVFLLLNLNIISFNWLILILSVIFLLVYAYKRQLGYLSAGLVLLAISVVSLIDQYTFTNVNIKGFVFLWILGIISLNMYSKYETRGYLIFGCLLPAIGTYSLIDEIFIKDTAWVFFLFLSIAFYIIYLLEYRRLGTEWPKTLSIIMIALSLLTLLTSKTYMKFGFWRFISYLWPLLLIGIGIKIIYNMIKYNK
ncbi:hypothetical protein [Anaerosalibacter massiliensis]|uniref:Uncharacterized protein n=1 Tax=Anaerosalibacter massiliensis TaxID=1347392 RepID=A0A9X2MHZ4_9FIRM|nr:hypothetical protein [Anaerosalibacter massiliensis]MCR2044388.1 hypothetical protein [Anaerosalibacter massiliensis]